ncbi:hypothetical protein HNW77_12870 [Komagataeibacter sp. AV436]|uniref:Uncharacterized protein n=1 Tax=Komagataeibacter melomenusus TaxID=2766578 RepID=A0ABX2AG13_9PROT|nr:hypothetical protein [Komagataeibacter melomenusus]MBV1831591.1 hypothetical protein [Komagataeibacter melomenusus]NPC67260.1 hypothetical protein [Komagataeibacter melomenusus]
MPVSPARGIPDDATPQYRQFAAEWGEDGHSHSYLTLRELLDYDWTHRVRLEGWLNLGEWVTWTGNNRAKAPDTYCAGIIGRSIRHVSTGTMEKLLERYHALSAGQERASFLAENADTYAQATWQIPAYAAIDYFWAETVPVLLHIARGTSGLDRVRIVFFFNN